MRSLWKDILAAFLIGAVLPGLLLNAVVMKLRREAPIQEIQITIPEETEAKTASMPVYVRSADDIVVLSDMDSYLTGVLLAEVPAAFEPEALKAQAIAARTYARKAWETGGKHGDGSVCLHSQCCQAYLEPEDYLRRGGSEEGIEKIRKAVVSTSGQCLQYEGQLIEATYFSCSGGSTESAVAVWGKDYPYLQAVDSPGEEEAAWFTDTVVFTKEQFCGALDIETERVPLLGDVTYTDGGGVSSMVLGGKSYSGTQLRSLLGLRSTAFEINIMADNVVITTKGYGHRVGMSQYGAEAMAMEGYTYREILAHYYPGTEVVFLEA